jgi:death-on-curing family protein
MTGNWATEGLPPSLVADLERVIEMLGPEARSELALSSIQVLRCHYLVADYFSQLGHGLLRPGVRSPHLLQSAVSRQHVGFGGRNKYNDLFTLAATLFFGLIKNHPFFDANKRTALLACFYQLQCHRRLPDAPQKEFEDLAESIAGDKLARYARYKKLSKNDDAEVLFIADWLRSKTRRVDKREYHVSYRQLDILLRRHGFSLGDPHDNKIHVYREVAVRSFLKRTKIEKRSVAQIGFKDWGTEVSGRDIKFVRSHTKLTDQFGVDSHSFFQGVDPIESLITQYRDLLKRLSRR